MQTVITSGNRAVVINGSDGHFWACLYVNTRDGIQNATATRLRFSGKTLKGAQRWTAKQLGA